MGDPFAGYLDEPAPAPVDPWRGVHWGAVPSDAPNSTPWDSLLDGLRDGFGPGLGARRDGPGACSDRIHRPRFEDLSQDTQRCFSEIRFGAGPSPTASVGARASSVDFLSQWPPTGCPSPCRNARPPQLPSRAQVRNALDHTPLLIPPTLWLRPRTEPLLTHNGSDPIRFTRQLATSAGELPAFELVANAITLLRLNADLLDWVACQIEEARAMDPRFSRVANLQQCMARAIAGEHAVYLISRFTRGVTRSPGLGRSAIQGSYGTWFPYTGAPTGPAMGGGSGQFEDIFNEGPYLEGAVIPVHHPTWVRMGQAVRRLDVNAFGAAVWMGAVILHEWMHRCIDNPAGTEDAYSCFAIHMMLARSYQWAMGQRYPALQSSCIEVADSMFMLGLRGPDSTAPPTDFRVLAWGARRC